MGAHPRSRGENTGREQVGQAIAGSSPLTRGKLLSSERSPRLPRLIPAHAGKTRRVSKARCVEAAHPRSRGENETDEGIEIEARGSSPLTRGKLRGLKDHDAGRRLIPAHAGKTGGPGAGGVGPGAHPRSRGENLATVKCWPTVSGSSPLTRGKHRPSRALRSRRRLIPAHAGKTGSRDNRPHHRPAHPRSRGENRAFTRPTMPAAGSSPLTRGKHGAVAVRAAAGRLIPAHAGKTTFR